MFRRGAGFVEERYGRGESLRLESIACALQVDDLYDSAGLSSLG